MSVTEPQGAPSQPSLEQRVAARRQQRVAKRSSKFILPVKGYEDLFGAQYRILSFEDRLAIATKHPGMEDDPVENVGASVDVLINACVDLLEVTGNDDAGDPVYQSLGKTWTSDSVAELFGTARQPSVRQALIDAVGSDDLMDHVKHYRDKCDEILAEGDKAAEGESEPSVEG